MPLVIIFFPTICLITRPCTWDTFHLRLQAFAAPTLCCAVLHGVSPPTYPAICVTGVGKSPITLLGARSTIRSSCPNRLSFLSVSALHVHAQSASWPSICPLETDRVSVQLSFAQSCEHAASRTMQRSSLTYHHRYGIAGLKVLARQKFVHELDLHLDSPDFPEACQEAYESTFHTDRGLRDVIIQAFRANPGLSLRQDVEMTVRETPGLAFELFRMASGLPITS